jgi:hypothetical protein
VVGYFWALDHGLCEEWWYEFSNATACDFPTWVMGVSPQYYVVQASWRNFDGELVHTFIDDLQWNRVSTFQ